MLKYYLISLFKGLISYFYRYILCQYNNKVYLGGALVNPSPNLKAFRPHFGELIAVAPCGNGGFARTTCNTLSEQCISPSFTGGGDISPAHDRSSDRPFRRDFRSLSTNRVWNLFRLPWLPAAGLGGLQPVLVLVGLVINDVCEVRDDVRENSGRDVVRLTGIDWLRCDGDDTEPLLPSIKSLPPPGDVDRLGHSERHSDALRERHVALELEHSDDRRERPVL